MSLKLSEKLFRTKQNSNRTTESKATANFQISRFSTLRKSSNSIKGHILGPNRPIVVLFGPKQLFRQFQRHFDLHKYPPEGTISEIQHNWLYIVVFWLCHFPMDYSHWMVLAESKWYGINSSTIDDAILDSKAIGSLSLALIFK